MGSTHYFRLGVFALTGVGLLFGGIVAFGAGSFFKRTIEVETYVDESVTGLDVGSTVRYRGVPVGKVKQFSLAANKYPAAEGNYRPSERKIVIEMALDKDLLPGRFNESAIRKAVTEGLRAKIMQSGFTGSAYLGLDFVDPKAFPPPALAWKPETVYIPSVPSTGMMLSSAIEHLSAELDKIDLPAVVAHFDTLLGGANKAIEDLKMPELREQALALLNEVRGTNDRVQRLLDDPQVKDAVHDLPEITGRLKASLARLDEITHDKRVDQTLSGVSAAATNAGPLAADMRRTMHDVRELIAAEQEDLRSAIADLRTVVENLNAVSEDARRNPSRLVFGGPPPHRKPGE